VEVVEELDVLVVVDDVDDVVEVLACQRLYPEYPEVVRRNSAVEGLRDTKPFLVSDPPFHRSSISYSAAAELISSSSFFTFSVTAADLNGSGLPTTSTVSFPAHLM